MNCELCGDTGYIEGWGPNEGCREYMDAPEQIPCNCPEGDKRAEEFRVALKTVPGDRTAEQRALIDPYSEELEAEWEERTERANR